MEKKENFSFKKRFKSFTYAFNGIKILFNEEHNFIIHLVAAIGVMTLGFAFNVSTMEWVALVIAIGLVFAFEIMNTAVENLADFVSPGQNEKIKKIKDLSAAAVLISAITAAAIGLIVFIPKIVNL